MMKYNKALILFLSLIGIHQLHGAAGVQLEVMIGNDHYELPMGSYLFVTQHEATKGCRLASNTLGILDGLKTHALLTSVFAYNPETTCVEKKADIPVVTEEHYLALCDSDPSDLELYAIKKADGGLFGLRSPAEETRQIQSEMWAAAVACGYANFYMNKEHVHL